MTDIRRFKRRKALRPFCGDASYASVPLALTLAASVLAFSACDASETSVDPQFRALAGTYRAAHYIESGFFSSCSYFDALERGGFFRMSLREDGSVADGRYFIGVEGARDRACDPFGSSEVAFRGSYTLSGDTLTLDLDLSCHQKWHQSRWLIEDSSLRYLGFDEGRGPCMPEATLQKQSSAIP